MSESDVWTVYTDGAARGNPGPAAFAYIIERPGEPDIEHGERMGEATNNVAEYTALLRALEHAQRLGGRRLRVKSDSDLLVQQMNGRYKVRHEGLRPLHAQANKLCESFAKVTFDHIPRDGNKRADRLCNEALDGAKTPSERKKKTRISPERTDRVRADAVQCLRTMAAAWARGNPQHPSPEDVWDQLWTILEDGGVLRSS
jgi:ribonuclease HI